MDLQEFDFVVKYRPGRVHNNAGAFVTLCPDINMRDAQGQDPSLAKLHEWKANGLKNAPRLKAHSHLLQNQLVSSQQVLESH